jgi:flagellar basal-body rod protein FlgF
MESDGTPTHLALAGPGFFTVELPDGKSAYTRNGAFHLNSQGELVTTDGWKLVSDGGPITLPKPTFPISINEAGEVIQEGKNLGKLQIANFSNPSKDLKFSGGGFFEPKDNSIQPEQISGETRVLQGFLESSNVNVVSEMVSMIQASRLYEANQKILQAQDSSLETVIRQVPNK